MCCHQWSPLPDPQSTSRDHYFHFKMIWFCVILKSGDGRTDTTCNNSDHYRPWLWVCLVDQLKNMLSRCVYLIKIFHKILKSKQSSLGQHGLTALLKQRSDGVIGICNKKCPWEKKCFFFCFYQPLLKQCYLGSLFGSCCCCCSSSSSDHLVVHLHCTLLNSITKMFNYPLETPPHVKHFDRLIGQYVNRLICRLIQGRIFRY